MKALSSKQRARVVQSLANAPWGPWERRVVAPGYREAFYARNGSTVDRAFRDTGFVNNHISVQVSDESSAWGALVHLWIRRHDGSPIRSWPVLQRIKNELVGADRVAVEVFPAQDDVVDVAPMSHLWVLPEDFVLPFSLKGTTR